MHPRTGLNTAPYALRLRGLDFVPCHRPAATLRFGFATLWGWSPVEMGIVEPMPTLYLSGPMTGIPDFNFPAFNQASARWRSEGYRVFNPAENFDGRTDLPRAAYMREDLAQVMQADIVAVLPGWKDSKGARLEVAMARELDLPVIDAITGEPATEPANVLDEAASVVLGDRRAFYGPPKINHTRTAAMWSAYLGVQVSPHQVCLMNILQKISRDANRQKIDNLVDIAGYALNAEMCR